MEYSELIKGVRFIDLNDDGIYIIDSMSDDLKKLIKQKLSEICYGVNKVETGSNQFSLKNTAKEFLFRLGPINVDIDNKQKGYLGEFLTHIILGENKNIEPLSLFFNLEERSPKKGFDLVFRNIKNDNIIIVEVKSGSRLRNQNSITQTANALIKKAKVDLTGRLLNPDDKSRLWNNALSHALSAVKNSNSEKDAILKLLASLGSEDDDNQEIVLAAGVFGHTDELIEVEYISKLSKNLKGDKLLNKICNQSSIVVIHNDIYKEFYNFLVQVSKND